MDFIRFSATSTNIFPAANSKTGSQLLSEWNLRSRESIATNSAVRYWIGPSYTHSQRDFTVRVQEDELGVAVSSTALEITDGRALVNGHYIESLSNVVVDIAEANRQLISEGKTPLKGHLAVGLRAFYSTEQTLAASMRVENSQDMWPGIQIVILPVGKIAPGYFVLPKDAPENEELVTAHLKLAEFYYVNGGIRSIVQNEEKVQAFEALRVSDFDSLLDKHYVRNDGLNPKKLYVMSGKSADGKKTSGRPTWCDSTDSLFIWQKAANLTTTEKDPDIDQAEFGVMYSDGTFAANSMHDETIASDETIALQIPHKTVDGGMWTTSGKQEYYNPRILQLPKADFSKGTPGTVSSSYTNAIKAISDRLNNFYHFPAGKQRAYIEELNYRTLDESIIESSNDTDMHVLPQLNRNNWAIGDYVLVQKDNTVTESASSSGNGVQAPSTMYVVLPPQVSQVTLLDANPRYDASDVPIGFNGAEILKVIQPYNGDQTDDFTTALANISSEYSFEDQSQYNAYFGIKTNYADETVTPLRGTFTQISKYATYAMGQFNSTEKPTPPILLEGQNEKDKYYDYQDYITLEITDVPTVINNKTVMKPWYFYFAVTNVVANTEAYSDPIQLTGSIPYATEDTIGGFLNVPETQLDAGYIYRDETGHLRLLDYALLRSGVLAYQLGQDYDFGSGLSVEEIQNELDEYVNDRVAFPTDEQKSNAAKNGKSENEITITITLSQSDSYGSISIHNIDSRWDTFVHVYITGDADSNTTVNISNIQKLKVTVASTAGALEVASGRGPVVNIYNSCLYYDSQLIQYVKTCPRDTTPNGEGNTVYEDNFTGVSNVSLWYEAFEKTSPHYMIDGMKVSEVGAPIIPEDKDFWSESVVNDYHYYYALQSITFDRDLNLIGFGLYMRNDSTENVKIGKAVSVAKFNLPQGNNLSYPEASLTRQMKIDGSFITSYATSSLDGYVIIRTYFTALTQSTSDTGTISFMSDSDLVEDFVAIDGLESGVPIDGWEAQSYHIFEGHAIQQVNPSSSK